MNPEISKKPLVDGFLMNASIRYLPYQFYPMALSNLEWLRRQNDQYNPRWYAAPFDFTVPILPWTAPLNYQIEAVPDSWVYGFGLCIVPGTPGHVSDLHVQVIDSCSGLRYFDNSILGSAFSTNRHALKWPILLSDPIRVENPGFLNVQISNISEPAENRNCQLVIHMYEPRWATPRYQAQRLS